MELAVSVGISFVPVFAFYMVYRKYSVFLPDYASHVLHFCIGAAGALALVLVSQYMPAWQGPWQTAFFRAALPERLLVFIVLLMSPAIRSKTNSLSEKIAAGIVTGIGFATVENILYGLEHGFRIVMPRLLVPLPLHAALGAFTAHWLGLFLMYRHPLLRRFSIAVAVCVPIIIHTLVDGLLFSGQSYVSGAFLLLLLVGLDYTMARVQMIPPQEVLDAMGMGYQEWKLVHDETSFERWLMQEHGAGFRPERLFVFRLSPLRAGSVAMLLLMPIAHSLWFSAYAFGISPVEQRLVFVVFPLFLALNLTLIGQVNPGYFRHGQIRIPFKIRTQIGEETEWASNVRLHGAFVRTVVPLEPGEAAVQFWAEGRTFATNRGRVVWQNHANVKRLFGSVVSLADTSFEFLWFVFRLGVQQVSAGIRYRARLPGFTDLAALFMQPETVGRDLRFFPAGTQLFREGDAGDTFFLVRKGTVSVYRELDGERLPLASLGPGELFGEMAITGHVPRNASAICQTDCVLAVGERDNLDRLIRSNVQFARQLIELAAARFHDTQHKVTGALERLESHERWRKVLEYAGLILLLERMGEGDSLRIPRDAESSNSATPPLARELIRMLGRVPVNPETVSVEAKRLAVQLYKTRHLRISWK